MICMFNVPCWTMNGHGYKNPVFYQWQMGSRFVATQEAGCHPKFKEVVTSTKEGDTFLALKKVGPVRMIRNKFFTRVNELEERGASKDELQALLGR